MRTKLKNIIPSIWIVEKKSKTNKTFTKGQGEKLKIKKMRINLENIIFC
jgi:hypothetical protein